MFRQVRRRHVKAVKFPAFTMKMLHRKYMLLAEMSLVSCFAFGGNTPASCELTNKSIVSRSPSGLAQVSNLRDIQITCRLPARPVPTKPGEYRNGLTAATTVYQVSANRRERVIPSEVHVTGGGGTPDQEYVVFHLHIPLDSAAQDTEARRYWAKIENSTPQEQVSDETRRQAIERLKKFIDQHRVGVFRVECRVLDGKQAIGVASVHFEVLFKGRFSDVGLPGAPPA